MVKISKMMRLKKLQHVTGLVQYHDHELLVYSTGNQVHIVRLRDEKKVKLRLGTWIYNLSDFGLIGRLFRLEVRTVVRHKSCLYIFWKKCVYVVSVDELKLIHAKALGFNPLNVRTCDDGVLFGSYTSNIDRREDSFVYLLKYEELIILHKLKNVRHVHGVIPSNNDKKFIILTGDDDAESLIALSDYRNMKILYSGSQMSRCVSGEIVNNRFIYGTDTPRERNCIMSVSLDDPTDLKNLGNVSSSVFWSLLLENGSVLFTTAVEPSVVNNDPKPKLYLVQPSDQVVLLESFDGSKINKKLWQYPQIRLVKSPEKYRFWCVEYANSQHRLSSLYELKEGP